MAFHVPHLIGVEHGFVLVGRHHHPRGQVLLVVVRRLEAIEIALLNDRAKAFVVGNGLFGKGTLTF